MLNLAWPWALWLLPLPVLVYLLVPRARRYDDALFVPFYQDVVKFATRQEDGVGRRGPVRMILAALTWCLLILALARPQWVGEPVALAASGRDLLLAVDISGSMRQDDMVMDGKPVTRLALVKQIVGDFVKRRAGDRVGLLLFGTEAYMHVPLTFDRQTLKTLLDEALVGFAGTRTSLGDAIGLAVKHLRNRPNRGRVLILLTDGRNTAGRIGPLQAARLAADVGVKIYTIGVGADEMLVRDFFGARRVNPSADLDEDTLQEIAGLTGGRYFRARDARELEEVYAEIDRLEPVEQESETFRPIRSLYYWPLSGALVLSYLVALLLTAPLLRRSREV